MARSWLSPSMVRWSSGLLASVAMVAAVTGVIVLLERDIPVLNLLVLYLLAVLSVAIFWGSRLAAVRRRDRPAGPGGTPVMSSSPAVAPTRARSVNGPLPHLLIGPGRLASPDVADPSPAAPRWLRLVPVRALTAPVAVRPAVALCVSLRMFLEPPVDYPLRSDLVHLMLNTGWVLRTGSTEGARVATRHPTTFSSRTARNRRTSSRWRLRRHRWA
jgi:hypothetical protein